MDLIQKGSNSEKKSGTEKSCTDCKTTKTPLWRGGPAGPKSLCNACGIRHRKKRSILGLKIRKRKEKSKSNSFNSNATSTSSGRNEGEKNLRNSMKMGLMALGKEVVLLQRQRSAIVRRKQRRDVNGEEEQAAAMLMALSCGFVFA